MKRTHWKILVYSRTHLSQYESERFTTLIERIKSNGLEPVFSDSITHLPELCRTNRGIAGVLIDWYQPKNKSDGKAALKTLDLLYERFPETPLFLVSEKLESEELPFDVLNKISSFFWLDDDTLNFISGRIGHLVDKYIESQYPPFFKAMVEYVDKYKYAWHTPGHMGGEGFRKSPIGNAFYHFFGENMMRSDLSISVPELGSLLDHSSVIKESEELAAETFGSNMTYYVLNGTSTANQIIWRSQVSSGDTALVDRNCHKSLNYAMVITDANPIYMKPRRNGMGIIGPVRLSEFSKQSAQQKIDNSPLIADKDKKIRMSALTNSTYDGVCYNIRLIRQKLKDHIDYLHFDEAWYAYANFHPVYDGFYGMSKDKDSDNPPIFCSHSTHKLLTAFSQASMIHVKHGSNEVINHSEFNEAYMMHGSTSPNYSMIASLDVATQMMNKNGYHITNENIIDAIRLRQKVSELHDYFKDKDEWFFSLWQPKHTRINGKKHRLSEVAAEELANHQDTWIFDKDADWHGFADVEDGLLLLDPIKLTFKTPGCDVNGKLKKTGIPACIVTDFLLSKGVVVEKTDTYSFLMLHSIGVSKGQHGELLTALHDFKNAYDNNLSIKTVFPSLYEAAPDKYENMGVADLATELHEFNRKTKFLEVMHAAFEGLPKQAMKPSQAYNQVVRKNVEFVPLAEMMGRIPAVMLVPYPPGIPVMMGGEILDESSQAIFDYLRLLEQFENTFPGYEKDIHGIERDIVDGNIRYKSLCIKSEQQE